MGTSRKRTSTKGNVEFFNPASSVRPRGWSHAVAVTGPAKTIYIGGQNAVDAAGAVVGPGDLAAQTEQVLKNVQAALAEAGGELHDVIKWNVYLVQGQSPQAGFEVFARAWGDYPTAPLITTVFVAGLHNPELLVEIEAVAIVV